MKVCLIIIILLLFTSCNTKIPSRYYRSPVEATGGFYNFSLELKSDRKLELSIEVSIQVTQSEEGEVWESNSKIITGKWVLNNKQINCSLDEPKSDIDSIFINTEFNNIDKPVVVFSQNLDTAFIYGIPCLLTNK